MRGGGEVGTSVDRESGGDGGADALRAGFDENDEDDDEDDKDEDDKDKEVVEVIGAVEPSENVPLRTGRLSLSLTTPLLFKLPTAAVVVVDFLFFLTAGRMRLLKTAARALAESSEGAAMSTVRSSSPPPPPPLPPPLSPLPPLPPPTQPPVPNVAAAAAAVLSNTSVKQVVTSTRPLAACT
jgi:hypothetical protein